MKDIQRIIVDNAVRDGKYTRAVLDRLPPLPVEYVDDTRDVFDTLNKEADPITEGKKMIVLERNKGAFLKACPGTKHYICCGYQILNFSTQCNLDCSYCILQSYFNNPAIRIFVNLDDLLGELHEKIDGREKALFRIGTGEFTDSLSLEAVTGFSEYIVPFFIDHPNTILELKTKTSDIAFLKQFDPQRRIMISWSLNAPSIQEAEEKKTASLEERLRAAQECIAHGYLVSFHFDPIIYSPGWEQGYQDMVSMLYDMIDPNAISWISMGCLRFMPSLKQVIQKRHPESPIMLGEFLPGLDGKMRYPKPQRIHMYQKVAQMLNFSKYKYKLYLCMESDEVWQKSLGFSPQNSAGLLRYLDEAVF